MMRMSMVAVVALLSAKHVWEYTAHREPCYGHNIAGSNTSPRSARDA